jgi:hypothetical protein
MHFQLLARYSPTPTSLFIYPAHSTQASAIVCQCLLVLRAPLRVLPGHISISLYTIQCYNVRITSRVSFLCIPLQLIISKDYFYFYHKYVSTSHRIVHAFTRHLLDCNTYTSTVMQYTTRASPQVLLVLYHTSTRHTNTGRRLILTPPQCQPLSTGTHNPGIELEPLHSYAIYT